MLTISNRILRDHETGTLAGAELGRLSAIVGCGAATLRFDGPATTVWLPLRGRLQLGNARFATTLQPGELRVIEVDSAVSARARRGIWVALAGNATAWRSALAQVVEPAPPEPLLLPARHAADHAVRRCAIALARAASPQALESAVLSLLDAIAAAQAQLAGAIERCPGRTYAKRRQVFARLQRVRNYLSANCHLGYDNAAIARMANYSSNHFLRTFHAVFEETPHAFLVNQRLQRARWLLRTSPLAIAEIAHASGFESRCAFSRLFRKRFGAPARTLRQAGSHAAPAAAT
jgi:AraC family transcriptional regulator